MLELSVSSRLQHYDMTCAWGWQVSFLVQASDRQQPEKSMCRYRGNEKFPRNQVVLFNEEWGIKAEVWYWTAVACCASTLPAISDLNASHCLADLFCIPALEPPSYGSAPYPHSCHSCWYPLLTPFPLSLSPHFYSQISLTLPPSVFAFAAFDLGQQKSRPYWM